MHNEISVTELHQALQVQGSIFLLDVRDLPEHEAFNIGGQLIPMNELPERLAELPKDKTIVVYCRSGRRSEMAVNYLKACGFNDVKNLAGGMVAWQEGIINNAE